MLTWIISYVIMRERAGVLGELDIRKPRRIFMLSMDNLASWSHGGYLSSIDYSLQFHCPAHCRGLLWLVLKDQLRHKLTDFNLSFAASQEATSDDWLANMSEIMRIT